MKLTKKERAMFINQFEILELLDPENLEEYKGKIKILSCGYERYYEDALYDVLWDKIPGKITSFVVKVLDFYRSLESYKNRHVNENILEGHEFGHFIGFDGNEEPEYYRFANYLIFEKKYYIEQKKYSEITGEFNSHHSTIDTYKKLLLTWKLLGKPSLDDREIIEEIFKSIA
jgi:uncharacterized protein YfbU (UPF0304 family)